MGFLQVTLIACVVVFTATAAICDWRTKRIPNTLTVTAFLAAILFHVISGAVHFGMAGAGRGVLFSLGGFATGFSVLFVLWIVGAGGGGDVKLMGALGSWLGAMSTLHVFLLSTVFVLIGSIGVLAWSACSAGVYRTKQRFISSQQGGSSRSPEKRRIDRRLMPYGVPVALATWSVLAHTGLKVYVFMQ